LGCGFTLFTFNFKLFQAVHIKEVDENFSKNVKNILNNLNPFGIITIAIEVADSGEPHR
jgi:hypothetical protein